MRISFVPTPVFSVIPVVNRVFHHRDHREHRGTQKS